MIEDFDGPDAAPSRRVHMRVVSVTLAAAALVGYAVASSTAFQAPFAEPRSSPAPSVRSVPLPPQIQIIDIDAASMPGVGRVICWSPAAHGELVFVGGGTMTVTTPLRSASPTCAPRVTPDTSRPPSVDRVSR